MALSYVGHWMYPTYSEALGEDLVLIPAPDFGNGAVTGMGSWNWGITSTCESPEGAAAFISFLMEPENIVQTTEANGAVPARLSVLAADERYAEGGDLYITCSSRAASPSRARRPRLPGHLDPWKTRSTPSHGEDVQAALTRRGLHRLSHRKPGQLAANARQLTSGEQSPRTFQETPMGTFIQQRWGQRGRDFLMAMLAGGPAFLLALFMIWPFIRGIDLSRTNQRFDGAQAANVGWSNSTGCSR